MHYTSTVTRDLLSIGEGRGEDRVDDPMRWQIVLVEGQPLLRDLLANRIRGDRRFTVIAEVGDPREAMEVCRRTTPHLVVTEVQLPHGDGLQLVQDLVKLRAPTRVLVLTRSTDPFTLHRLHEMGMHGFVEKDQSLEILEEALIEVASGKTYFTALWGRTQASLRADPDAFTKILSAREQEILRAVAAGQTSKMIAARLGLSLRSVETYRYRMMRKLGIDSMAGLIEFGLRLSSVGTASSDERDDTPTPDAVKAPAQPGCG